MTYRLELGGAIRLDTAERIERDGEGWSTFLAWLADGNVPLPRLGGFTLDQIDTVFPDIDEIPPHLHFDHPCWQPA